MYSDKPEEIELPVWREKKEWNPETNEVDIGTYETDNNEWESEDEYEETRRRNTPTQNDLKKPKDDDEEESSDEELRREGIWNPPLGEELTKLQLYKAIKKQKIEYFEKDPKKSQKLWIFALDSTDASKRAFNEVVPTLDPKKDVAILVNVRINQGSASSKATLLNHYRRWTNSINLLFPFHKKLKQLGINHAVISPADYDPRKCICLITKNNKADYLVLGLHKKEERVSTPKDDKYPHWRSMHYYCKHYAHGELILVK